MINLEKRGLQDVKQSVNKSLEEFNKALKRNPSLLKESNIFSKYRPDQDKELIENTYKILLNAKLMGMAHATGKDSEFSDVDVSYLDKALTFKEAAQIASGRVALTKADFNKLADQTKMQAFTIGRLTQLDMIERAQRTYLENLTALESSTDNFIRTMIQQNPATADMVNVGGYYENVYRTNIQKDYNSGRALQFANNPPQFLEFIGIEDGRQSDICRACSGVILPYTDPWWDTHWPPLHFNCRSTVRAIYSEELQQMGVNANELKKASLTALKGTGAAMQGFGSNPVKNNATWSISASQMSRIGKAMIEDELNKVAGQTVCKDFAKPKSGFSYAKTTSGGVRYPDKIVDTDEFKNNLKSAQELANKKGLYIELQEANSPRNNNSWDAWVNATEKIDFKWVTSLNNSTLSGDMRQAAEQADSLFIKLTDLKQFEKDSFPSALYNRISKMKNQGRSFVRLFISYEDNLLEFTWKDIYKCSKEELLDLLTPLIN